MVRVCARKGRGVDGEEEGDGEDGGSGEGT